MDDVIKRNIKLRLIMTGKTMADLARAVQVDPSTVRARLIKPAKHLAWWAVALVVPIDALTSNDPVITASGPLPDGWEGNVQHVLGSTGGGNHWPGLHEVVRRYDAAACPDQH